jgi:hypothetical protein
MALSREEVKRCMIETLQTLVQGDQVPPMDDTTDPLAGLGLESDDGLDFACVISEKLGFHFPDDKNPFIDDSGRCSRRIGEIVDMIMPMLPK